MSKRFDKGRDDARQPLWEHALDPKREMSQALGVAGQRKEHEGSCEGHARGREAADLDPGEERRIAAYGIGCRGQDEERKQRQDRDEIEQPLEDDGGEGGGRVQTFPAGKQIGPEHLAGPGR